MLIEVLTRLAADTGYEPVQQRTALISLLNSAALELYNMLECNRIYREVTLVVQPDSIVALPSFVGEVRGVRMHTNELPFDMQSIGQPRYVSTTLAYKFKNWRDLGDVVTHTIPAVVNKLTIETDVVENAEILISGQTNVANRIEEVITLDATSKQTTKLFGPQLYKIACLTERTSDIVIKDNDGNELAILYNTDLQTRYKLIDVSQVFWTLDTTDGMSLIDTLYKIKLDRLIKDTDSFPAGDMYDNAWYFLAYHLFLKPLQDRSTEAAAAYGSCLEAIKACKDGSEQNIAKKLQFGRNRFLGLFRKYRYYPGSVTNVDNNIQS